MNKAQVLWCTLLALNPLGLFIFLSQHDASPMTYALVIGTAVLGYAFEVERKK